MGFPLIFIALETLVTYIRQEKMSNTWNGKGRITDLKMSKELTKNIEKM